MSEVENQDTNGTSNGDVPEIELIIKEEFVLENEILGNANGSKINLAPSEVLNGVDEKENIAQSKLYLKPQQQHQNVNECKTINSEKQPSPLKDVLAQRSNEATEDHVLALTHHDSQHFYFEFVTPKPDENLSQTVSITERTTTNQLSDNLNSGKIDDRLPINQKNRVPLSQNQMMEEATVKEEHLRCSSAVSNLDFAAMVAEACEGIFDEIENDLRSYTDSSDSNSNSYQGVEITSDSGDLSAPAKRKKSAHNSEAVQLAVNAVLEGGMSLGEAAKRYNVVRSTVSSRVAKHPKRKRRRANKELDELIHSKLMAGIQISQISRSLHVPKSTVHLHKTRLKESGMLPPVWIRNGSKDMVDHGVQERLKQAYRGHIVNGMSVRFAAEFFSLPLTTLWRYIKRRKTASTTAVTDDSSKSVPVECSNDLEENTLHNASNAFDDLDIDEQSQMQESKSPCVSPKCYTDLLTVFDKDEEMLEQSLLDHLLE
ncbi:uncharacterized protein LOC129236852 isoform X1 [Anastrepha obliqua]|uniref:uncharacterized protein LOC129236852 isoform X1 n=1 Tax=Anastrepha obliqua TaxID=95512 RepID=UPI00240A7DCD|nr:uncharacterized protein LOC129236852 isoform X1 [Anastrepha obliqua]XP_054727090.1 uncharacterized protein LOC129236852 isoform X1 [Anastrepha obliqua]XP_054727091.1 uncharacterized protein LOC129236852 isoform X1 [Anastrepha obliqua]XP_054727092.1 uncharacterized protein LOC129236852 isoform X1 [Anastrepha obliqua]XP_054727093.1 uncharacterized protein LOC129236852 isoform X1 [Anastrepha obliqua]